ncbi:hypothetical protein MMC13_005080 [Lambiella insularis]|nr:hypothetical protein [Lambiella insularis]
MCLHTTHAFYLQCRHLTPIPPIVPFYVPLIPCLRLTSELEWYHTQPDRLPEQVAYPAPKPCPITPATIRIQMQDGVCYTCAQGHNTATQSQQQLDAPQRDVLRLGWTGAGAAEPQAEAEQWPHGDRVRVSPLIAAAEGPAIGEEIVLSPSMGTLPSCLGTETSLVRTLTTAPTDACSTGGGAVQDVPRAGGVAIARSPEVVGAWWKEGERFVREIWKPEAVRMPAARRWW